MVVAVTVVVVMMMERRGGGWDSRSAAMRGWAGLLAFCRVIIMRMVVMTATMMTMEMAMGITPSLLDAARG